MEIKVITIDFWNTLFDSSNGKLRNTYRQETMLKEISRLGKSVEMSELKDAMHASWEFFDQIWKNEMRTPSPYETVEFFLGLPANTTRPARAGHYSGSI